MGNPSTKLLQLKYSRTIIALIVKGSTCLFCSSIFLITLLISSFLSAQDTPPTVAVIDFEGRGITQMEAQTLTDRFRSSISNTGAVRLVERSLMERLLEEQGFQQTGCTTSECAVAAGEILGVEYIFGGAIGKIGNTYTIDVKMISVETGAMVRTSNASYVGSVDGLIVEVEILAYQTMSLDPPQDVLRRRKVGVETPTIEARQEEIPLAEDTRPTVAVIDFEGRGITILEAQTLTDRLRSSIGNTGAVRLIERRMMEDVLQEQGFQRTGCISDECVVEVGQLLGVQNMVIGSIGKVGETYTIDARMISVETGVSIRTRNVTYVGKVDALITEVEILAYEIVEMDPPSALIKKRKMQAQAFMAQQGGPRVKTRMGAMMRSLVFPGFGQFYAERKLWGYGWILSEVAVVVLIYSSYMEYQTAYDDYNKFVDLYDNETDAARIVEYKAQARESHINMNDTNEQIKVLTGVAGGIWIANVMHVLIVGPKIPSGNVYKEPALKLVYDPITRLTQLRWEIALD